MHEEGCKVQGYMEERNVNNKKVLLWDGSFKYYTDFVGNRNDR